MKPTKIKISDSGVEVAKQHAELTGKKWNGIDGYGRDNDGSWSIVEEGGAPICRVAFRGKAKRGQGYAAPDPEGFAIAQKIVELWNAQP